MFQTGVLKYNAARLFVMLLHVGLLLHNRGSLFLSPSPLTRPFHTLTPAIVTRKGQNSDDLEECFGCGIVGGFMQAQGLAQLILNLQSGMKFEEALNHPRVLVTTDRVMLEDRSENGQKLMKWLVNFGHPVSIATALPRELFGSGQIAGFSRDAFFSVTDKRSYGSDQGTQ